MIGLIIRFRDKIEMDEWIDESNLIGDWDSGGPTKYDPPLQARPMDSSDPKELYVLNTGRDGDQ